MLGVCILLRVRSGDVGFLSVYATGNAGCLKKRFTMLSKCFCSGQCYENNIFYIMGSGGSFPGVQSGQGLKLSTHL
jgi:hypothetical protein